MEIKKYSELSGYHVDILREIGSIGSGNATTSLSGVIGQSITMRVPEVRILENNEAIEKFGGPEKPVIGVLVKLSGGINGMVLYLQGFDFINFVLQRVLGKTVDCYDDLDELDLSALLEIGNIMISSYMGAVSELTGIETELSVPAISISMLGAILSVPMVEYGYNTDVLMTIADKIVCEENEMDCNLILIPEISSLNTILKKLGAFVD